MKFIPAGMALFFIIFVIVTGLLFLKVNSLEKRLAGVPKASEIDRRFSDIESSIDARDKASYSTSLNIHERLSALETGVGKSALAGPQTVDFLLTSLRQDFLAFNDSADDPDMERSLGEKLAATLGRLEKKVDEGDDVVAAIVEELKRSQDRLWKVYLLRDVIWRMGPAAGDELLAFFRNRENSGNQRVLAARSLVLKIGRRSDLRELARALEDREEDLTLKKGLATLFYDHPFPGAEEGLIAGVRGLAGEDGKVVHYHPTHRRECVRALGRHDSPRVVKFLESLILETLSSEKDDEADPYIPVLAIDAYNLIQGERAVDFFELLLGTYPMMDENFRIKIDNVLADYGKDGSSGEGNGSGGGER